MCQGILAFSTSTPTFPWLRVQPYNVVGQVDVDAHLRLWRRSSDASCMTLDSSCDGIGRKDALIL
jgi:hypothetical protein